MNHQTFHLLLFVSYILGMTGLMVWQGIGIAPDRYVFILLLGSLFIKKTRGFLFDWLPFLFILLSYDFLRGFADNLSSRVNYLPLIQADFKIFGFLPTEKLQSIFFHPNQLQWYDFLATIFYFLHFALPLTFGYLLWLQKKSHFREFVTAILILSYTGWITYIVYPAAPPWLAQQEKLIFGVTKIMDYTFQAFPEKLALPTIYHQFNPNPVAAIPSMHAAYPFLVFLYIFSYFRLRSLLFFPYVLGVWISIVYLGEHYVVDVVFGAFYAFISFVVAKWLLHNVKFQKYFLSLLKEKRSSFIWLKKSLDKLLGWNATSVNLVTTSRKKTPSNKKTK